MVMLPPLLTICAPEPSDTEPTVAPPADAEFSTTLSLAVPEVMLALTLMSRFASSVKVRSVAPL
jgi:hypothetical protein